MKKIGLLLTFLLFLSGCSVKEYTPEIPISFKQEATVSSGDFSFDCEICRNEGSVCVSVLSTQAQNMTMVCDGNKLTMTYCNYSRAYDVDDYSKLNIAVIVYQALNQLDTNNVNALKTDSGYKYQGNIAVGDFELIQNDDNTFNMLIIKSAAITVSFK